MSNSKLLKRDEQQKKLMLESGTRLFEAIPVLFPDHALMEELVKLRRERDSMHDQMMARQWRDNGPAALYRAMRSNNSEFNHCHCLICNDGRPYGKTRCRLWERFVWYMNNCGITWIVVHDPAETDPTALGFGVETIFPGIPNTVHEESLALFPAPPDFNPLTACKYVSPVSHIDLHLVFRRVGRVMAITFGRKIWQKTSLDDEEVRKYDLLMARLRI